MQSGFKLSILFIVIFFTKAAAALPSFTVNETSEPATINNSIFYHTAKAQDGIDLQKIQSMPLVSNKRTVNLFEDQTVWTGFEIMNDSAKRQSVYLEFYNDSIHHIDVYLIQNGQMSHFKTGLAVKPAENDSVYRWPVIHLQLDADSKSKVYVKFGHMITFSGPVVIQRKSQFEEKLIYEFLRYGIMYGTLTLLLGYIGFAYLRVKEPVFVTLFLTITSFSILLMALDSIPDRNWLFHLFPGSKYIVYATISSGTLTVLLTQMLIYRLISPQVPGNVIRKSGRWVMLSVLLCSIYIITDFVKAIYIAGWLALIWSGYLIAVTIYFTLKIKAFMGFIAAGVIFLGPVLLPLCFPGYDLAVQIAPWVPWMRLAATPASLLITIGVMHKISRAHSHYRSYLEELTESRKSQLQLETRNATEAKELKEQILRIVSHDMRSPLSAIRANIPLIRSREVPKETKSLLIQNIDSTVDELLKMSEWLITTSEVRESASKTEPEWLNLHSLTENVFEKHELQASRKEISLINKTESSVYILADPSLASQMIGNLVNNAVKFCSREDSVTVSFQAGSIIVKDTGAGLQAAAVEKFNQNQVIESTPGSFQEKGTGLGLTITREIAQLHDGSVSVESEHGKGAVFKVKLPEFRISTGSNRAGVILIVDDDPDVRLLLKSNLVRLNIGVIEAGDGAQALRILKKLPVKLVISDLNMPGMDGISLHNEIEQLPKHIQPEFWLMSAYEKTHPEYKKAEKTGIVKILEKPIDPDSLVLQVSSIF